MFGIFKHPEWKAETLAELRGAYQNLKVTIRNVPCLHDAKSGDRKYAYADFGYDFLMKLHEQLGDFQLLRAKLKTGASVQTFVRLPSYPPITVELVGTPSDSHREFDSDLADALIKAFENAWLHA